jgi:putative flippase GtrA
VSTVEADSALGPDRWRPALPAGLLRLGTESLRYLLVSAIALACDVAVYATLIGSGINATAAGAAGYTFGMLVHYALSTRWVFPDPDGVRRTAPTLVKFIATGFLGLATTATIIEALTREHIVGAFAAKAVAVGAAYIAVFLLRRIYVFGATSRTGAFASRWAP